jgi:hypothetical protein
LVIFNRSFKLSEHINSAKNKPLNDSGVQSSAERKRIEKEQRIADMKNLAEARKLREAKERENDKLH